MPDSPLTAELEAVFRLVWERESAKTKNKGVVQVRHCACACSAFSASPSNHVPSLLSTPPKPRGVQKDGAATSTAARAAKPPAITPDALKLSSSLVEAFVRELVGRARELAVLEGDASVQPAHLERILPQLLLDF
jgi:hypothetical protein